MIFGWLVGIIIGLACINFAMTYPSIFGFNISLAVGFSILPAVFVGFIVASIELHLVSNKQIKEVVE